MEETYKLKAIGSVHNEGEKYFIRIKEEYKEGLLGLKGFSHLHIIWWGHLCDNDESRERLKMGKLFKNWSEEIGVFATHAPMRPNPVLSSTINILEIDFDKGIIHTPFIDAEDGTPVLDIKPYHMMERVRDCRMPEWASHWPQWYEDAAEYDWDKEINR